MNALKKGTTTMKKFAMLIGLLLSVGFSSLVWAQSLDQAKSQGLVGEKVDGYIAAVVASPSPEIQALIQSTNDGRRKAYEELARRNNIPVEQVGIVSAEKLQGNAAPGEYIQSPSGQWVKK
jgi:uncharacterized protein YdbL (DUF1318 family)